MVSYSCWFSHPPSPALTKLFVQFTLISFKLCHKSCKRVSIEITGFDFTLKNQKKVSRLKFDEVVAVSNYRKGFEDLFDHAAVNSTSCMVVKQAFSYLRCSSNESVRPVGKPINALLHLSLEMGKPPGISIPFN